MIGNFEDLDQPLLQVHESDSKDSEDFVLNFENVFNRKVNNTEVKNGQTVNVELEDYVSPNLECQVHKKTDCNVLGKGKNNELDMSKSPVRRPSTRDVLNEIAIRNRPFASSLHNGVDNRSMDTSNVNGYNRNFTWDTKYNLASPLHQEKKLSHTSSNKMKIYNRQFRKSLCRSLMHKFMWLPIWFRRRFAIAPSVESLHSDESRTVKFDKALRRVNLLMFIVALIGIFIMIITESLEFSWWSIHSETINYQNVFSRVQSKDLREKYGDVGFQVLAITYFILHICNILNTILLLLLLSFYYSILSKKKCVASGYKTRISAFLFSTLWLHYLLEFLLLLYTPIPYYLHNIEMILPFSASVESNDLSLLMFLRLYLVFRVIRDYSNVYISRLRILDSNEDLKKSDTHFDWYLTWRLLLYSKTFSVFLFSSVAVTMIVSFCLWITEREENHELIDFIEVVYFAFQCLTTIGYGTYTPLGRFISRFFAIGLGFIGFMGSAFFSAVVINRLSASDYQIKVTKFNIGEKYKKKRLDYAVRYLQLNYLYKIGKCSFRYKSNTQRVCIKKLHHYKRKIAQFTINSDVEMLENILGSTEKLNKQVLKLITFSEVLKQRLKDCHNEKCEN